MSLYVMKRKADRNRIQREMNASGGGFVLNVSNTGRFETKCSTSMKKAPAPQKSYSQYQRTNLRCRCGNSNGGTVWKQTAKFGSSTHVNNVKSKALRCEYSLSDLKKDSAGNYGSCKQPEPVKCLNDSYNKKNVKITKDLGFMTAGQQIEKKVATRVSGLSEYDVKPVGNTKCSGT